MSFKKFPLHVSAIVLDLDGTLLHSDGTISERTKAAARSALAAGIELVLVTARGPRTVADIADELGVRGEAICSNGAIVLDLETRRILKLREIETEVALELVRARRPPARDRARP